MLNSLVASIGKQYWYNLDTPRHLVLFSAHTLSRLMSKQKLSIKRTEFYSVGGIVGTIQYYLAEKTGLKAKLINNPLLIIIFYPIERLLDWCKLGDIFSIYATK